MKSLIFALLAFAASAIPARAQCQVNPLNVNRYVAVKETVLAAAAEKVTVQQPGGRSNRVAMECGDVYCSVACTVSFYQNGSAATTTTLAVQPLNLSQNPTAVAFSSSNVGGSAYKTYYLAAGATMLFDLSKIFLPSSAGGGSNFSIGTNSISGTARIQIQWVEQ